MTRSLTVSVHTVQFVGTSSFHHQSVRKTRPGNFENKATLQTPSHSFGFQIFNTSERPAVILERIRGPRVGSTAGQLMASVTLGWRTPDPRGS